MRSLLGVPTGAGRPRRRTSIRTLLVVLAIVPSLALGGLWVYTTSHIWSEISELREQNNISTRAGLPAYTVMTQLQEERRLSAAWLAAPNEAGKAALDASRNRTDAALGEFLRLIGELDDANAETLDKARLIQADRDQLPAVRARIDRRDGNRPTLLRPYAEAVETQLVTFTALSRVDSDGKLTYRSETLVDMFRAAEMIAREDALVTYAQGARKLGPDEYLEFTEAAGARRGLYADQIVPNLEPEFERAYQSLTANASWQKMVAVETAVLAAGTRGPVTNGLQLPPEADGWRTTMDEVALQVATLNTQRAGKIVADAVDQVDDQETTVWLITGTGLAVVLVVAVLCWTITRSLRRRLLGLHHATVELAEERLPSVVERLSRGEAVDVSDALDTAPHRPENGHALPRLPELAAGKDEIGQVAAAFDTAQRAAVDGAVRLARERAGYAKVFHNVALRTQSLVGRQLRLLDTLENRHQDPELLSDLFVLDHLATRLRRYEENLVILSGNQPGRRWSRPVRMIDVVRSAVGEVEDYHRVDVRFGSDLALSGPAVGGVIHLLAELLENATTFSPPDTPVEVRGMPVAKGLVVEIEDRGLGMGEEEYAALNAELAHPTPFDMVALADDLRLGLFVVAQLAQRHGVSVTLRPSPYGGTLAIVFVPKELIVGQDGHDVPESPAAAEDGTGASAEDAAAGGTRDTAAGDATEGAPVPGDAPDAGPAAGGAAVTEPLAVPDRDAETDPAPDRDAPSATARVVPFETPPNATRVSGPRTRPGRETRVTTAPADAVRTEDSRPKPLPRRVRQASLAAPLRETPATGTPGDAVPDPSKRPTPEQAAATISAFQRASERARAADLTTESPTRERS